MPETIPELPPPTFRPGKAFGPWLGTCSKSLACLACAHCCSSLLVGASLDFVLTGMIICMVLRSFFAHARPTQLPRRSSTTVEPTGQRTGG